MGSAEWMKLIRFSTRSVESWPPTSFASRKRQSSRDANAHPHLRDHAAQKLKKVKRSIRLGPLSNKVPEKKKREKVISCQPFSDWSMKETSCPQFSE